MEAIYARQSIDKKDSVSIETQIELCRKECCHDDVRIYIDKGYSGKNTDRPSFQSLISDIKGGSVKKVIIYRLDRLSRSVSDFSRIWEIFRTNDVKFSSISEKFDSATPIGNAMIYIIMTFAQLERETIAERIADNYYARLRRGSWPGGPAPFGFTIAKSCCGEICVPTLKANENIELVKEIFYKYAYTQTSLSSLACFLMESHNGTAVQKKWDNTGLVRILRSPVYVTADADIFDYYIKMGMGNILHKRDLFNGSVSAFISGKRQNNRMCNIFHQSLSLTNFPGTIDSKTWLLCQNKLSKNHQKQCTPSHTYSWLNGLLKCGRCGYSITFRRPRDKIYLCCSGHYNFHICNITSVKISLRLLENIVQHEIFSILSSAGADPPSKLIAASVNSLPASDIKTEIDALIKILPKASDFASRHILERIETLNRKKEDNTCAPEHISHHAGCDYPAEESFFSALKSSKEMNILASSLIDKILISDEEIKIIWSK